MKALKLLLVGMLLTTTSAFAQFGYILGRTRLTLARRQNRPLPPVGDPAVILPPIAAPPFTFSSIERHPPCLSSHLPGNVSGRTHPSGIQPEIQPALTIVPVQRI